MTQTRRRTSGDAPSSQAATVWACAAALLLFVAGRCLVPMDETDLFYNLRLGEIVLGTHAVPRTNLLSFTAPDFPDPNLAWLFQVVLALAYRAAGVPGTVVLKTAFVVATFAILFRVALRRGAHPAWAAATLALAAWAAEPRFVERPHLVTFLGLAILLLALERAQARPARPLLLWLMVPAGLLWANGNSCFFLAPVVLALYAGGTALESRAPASRQAARRAGVIALLLLPLLFATPSGRGWIGYVVNHFRMPSLRPLQEYRLVEWPLDGPFLFLLVAVALVTVFPLSPMRTNQSLRALGNEDEARRLASAPSPFAGALLPILALALLGSRRVRFVAEFALLAGPYVAARVSGLARANLSTLPPPGWRRFGAPAVVSALVALTLFPRLTAARAGEPVLDLGIEEGLVPDAAIRWLDNHDLRDRLYNDLEVGSYLSWQGWPRHRVFQDPRINGYPESLHAILRHQDLSRDSWQELMNRFNIRAALITYPSVNPRAALFDPARWALCYQTAEALVFVRRGTDRDALISSEELPLSFKFDPARGVTAVVVPSPPPGSKVAGCEWQRRRGEIEVARRAWPAANRAYIAALEGGADCLPPPLRDNARERAAMLALRSGQPARAADLLSGLTSPGARSNRGFALLQLGRHGEALTAFEQVLSQVPEDAEATFGRALALTRLGPRPTALAALRRFLARWPEHFAAPQAQALLARLLREEDLSRENAP